MLCAARRGATVALESSLGTARSFPPPFLDTTSLKHTSAFGPRVSLEPEGARVQRTNGQTQIQRLLGATHRGALRPACVKTVEPRRGGDLPAEGPEGSRPVCGLRAEETRTRPTTSRTLSLYRHVLTQRWTQPSAHGWMMDKWNPGMSLSPEKVRHPDTRCSAGGPGGHCAQCHKPDTGHVL